MNLHTDKINSSFPADAVEQAKKLIGSNYSFNRSYTSEDYPFVATYKVSHLIRYGIRAFPFQRAKNGPYVFLSRPANAAAIPQQIVEAAKGSKREFVHVLLLKRLFYYEGKQIRSAIDSDANPNQPLGYFSNSRRPTKRALKFLSGVSLTKEPLLLQLHEFAIRIPRLARTFVITLSLPMKKAA